MVDGGRMRGRGPVGKHEKNIKVNPTPRTRTRRTTIKREKKPPQINKSKQTE